MENQTCPPLSEQIHKLKERARTSIGPTGTEIANQENWLNWCCTSLFCCTVCLILASSLRWALDKASGSVRKTFQGNQHSTSGLTIHPHTKVRKKAKKFCFEQIWKIVIWEGLINFLFEPREKEVLEHECELQKNCETFELHRDQIAAIVYNHRFGTPIIHKGLVGTLCQSVESVQGNTSCRTGNRKLSESRTVQATTNRIISTPYAGVHFKTQQLFDRMGK